MARAKGPSMVFVRRVLNHPGMKAQPFMRPAMASGREFLNRIGQKQFAQNINKGMSIWVAADLLCRTVAGVVRVSMIKLCPVDKGRLRGSITIIRIGPLKYGVGTNVIYAIFVELGTGLHGPKHQSYPIFPKKTGGVLVFPGRKGASRKAVAVRRGGRRARSKRRRS